MVNLFQNGVSNRRKIILLGCLILAISIKSLISYYYFQLEKDKITQAVATMHWINGYGLSIKQANPEDLSKTIYTPISGWPPGYSIILAPIFLLTKDIIVSIKILMFISILLFFGTVFCLLSYLKIPTFYFALLLLLYSSSFTEDVVKSTSTDILAVTACLFAINYALKIIRGENKIVSFSIVNCLSTLLRYMYWPISIILPLILIWVGLVRKDKLLKKRGFIGFSIAIITCLSIYIFEKVYIGNALFLFPFETGFYPKNLLQPYPFLVTAFLNQDFYAQQLGFISGIDFTQWKSIFIIIHIVLFLIILYKLFNTKFTLRGIFLSTHKTFIFICAIFYLIIILTLATLSIRYNNYFPPLDFSWTYISSERYYLFMLITIPVIVIILQTKLKLKSLLFKGVFFMTIVLISLEVVHGIYFSLKSTLTLKPETNTFILQSLLIENLAEKINLNNKNNIQTIVAGNSFFYSQMPSIYGGTGLLREDILISGNIRSSKPVEIVLIVSKGGIKYYTEFLSNPKVYLEKKIDDYYLYSYKYDPGK